MSRLLAILLVLASTGCSLLIDTDPYLGDGRDAGPRDGAVDGAVDAMVDPDAPSAPTVHIEPSAPTTLDDLSVVIDTESVDPLAAGAVTYEYRWVRDGSDASVTVDNVASADTAKGEVWRVEVRPVSADSSRRGAPGTAEVTIGNLPPTLAFVGLDSYRPIEGEILQAIVGPASDPDGDSVRVDYTWYADDVAIPAVTGPRLTLSAGSIAVGASIRVEATPTDMVDDGPTLHAGPAILLSDTTRWRQLLPNRTFREGDLVAFDPGNRRLLLVDTPGGMGDAVQLWEHALDSREGKLVQLFPAGAPGPLSFTSVAYDEANRRLILFGGLDLTVGSPTNEVWSLDLSVRGSERWEQLSPTGDSPEPRYVSSMAYDPTHQRVLVFGGGGASGDFLDDLWSLDVSSVGFESWTQHTGASPGALAAAGFVVDPSHDRALLIGGGVISAGGVTPFDAVSTLDLGARDDGFAASGATLPAPLLSPDVGYDPDNHRIIVAFGMGDARVPSNDIYAIDAESLTVTTLVTTGDGPTQGGSGIVAKDPYADRLIVFPGNPEGDRARVLDVYELAGSVFTPIHRYGVDAPIALHGAAAGASWGWQIFGGETLSGEPNDAVITFDFDRRTWARPTATADAVTGRSPLGRGRLGVGVSGELSFFGGYGASGLTDTVLWTLHPTTATEVEWQERTLRSGATALEGREWPTVFEVSCSGPIGFFGGSTSSGASNETGIVNCTDGVRDCEWTDPTTSTRPSPRFGAAAARLANQDVVLFGGSNGSVLGDVWTIPSCITAGTNWTARSPTGAAPSARWGHTMTREGDFSAPAALVFGGFDGADVDFADTHRIVRVGAGNFRWETVDVASGTNDRVILARYGHVAVYDDVLAPRLLVYGGTHANSLMSDLWELRLR